MGRLFFLMAVAVVVYLLLRSYSRPQQQSRRDSSAQSEEMVRCVHCGVHLPRSESVLAGGNFYCCDEHRRAHEVK